jgi:DNA processing protein
MEIKKITLNAPDFPALLHEIPDPPQQLYYLGNLDLLKKNCVGIVGMRRCSTHGENMALQMAQQLSDQNVCIVSGLAFGIDAAAHRGALKGVGGTVAIMAQGLHEIRPAQHRELAKEILAHNGLLLSEKEPGAPALKHEYLVRNRLISGLSKGIVVVEAALRSGAANTAKHALEQNRYVMAVPGRVSDECSQGTNKLIWGGAHLVQRAKDVADFLGLPWERNVDVSLAGMTKLIYKLIEQKPRSAAELGDAFQGHMRELYGILTELELRGIIRRGSDARYFVGDG